MAQEILRVTQKLDIIEEDPETLKKDILGYTLFLVFQ